MLSLLLLGMLEHYKGQPAVRVLFQKKGNDWVALKNQCEDQACLKSITKEYPAQTEWTIAFDGKKIGAVTAKTPADFQFYSAIGRQDLAPKTKVPSVGKPSKEFAGWSQDLVPRPLVAISQPNYQDPESWKPAKAMSPILLGELRADFKKTHPTCECNEFDDRVPPCQPAPFKDAQIRVQKQYQSQARAKVIQLKLDCGEKFSSPDETYTVSPDGHPARMGPALKLIDAGDYDNDGRSELVFQRSGHNRDEYLIYYDALSKTAVFPITYH